MTRYSRDLDPAVYYNRSLDPYDQIEASVNGATGDVTLLYVAGHECNLDAKQALELLSFLLSYQAPIRQGYEKAQQTEHAESFWYTDTFKPSKDCDCKVCRYIRCDDGDEEFIVNFPDVSHMAFDQRMVELDLHYSC